MLHFSNLVIAFFLSAFVNEITEYIKLRNFSLTLLGQDEVHYLSQALGLELGEVDQESE